MKLEDFSELEPPRLQFPNFEHCIELELNYEGWRWIRAWSSLPVSHPTQVYDQSACSFLASQFISLQLDFSFCKILGCAKQVAKNGDGIELRVCFYSNLKALRDTQDTPFKGEHCWACRKVAPQNIYIVYAHLLVFDSVLTNVGLVYTWMFARFNTNINWMITI